MGKAERGKAERGKTTREYETTLRPVEVGLFYLRRVKVCHLSCTVLYEPRLPESSLGFEEEPLVTWAWGEGPLPADRLTG